MQSVDKIYVWPASKMVGTIFAILGFVVAILFIILLLVSVSLLNSVLGGGSASKTFIEGTSTVVMVLVSLLLFPILFGVFGMVGTMILTLIYNAIAFVYGGIKFDLGR